jgi:hypothetical protein
VLNRVNKPQEALAELERLLGTDPAILRTATEGRRPVPHGRL